MQKLITPYCADFGKPNIIIKHFPDTESYVRIPQINSLKNKIIIYHRLYPEPDKRIFELFLVLSRLKKETKHIELFAPYLPYSRQDKENKEGEVVSADELCAMLKSHGVKKLITYDCHFLPKPGNFTRNGLKIENKSAGKILYANAKKYFGKENFMVISPDEGASYFTENAQRYSLKKKRKQSKATGVNTGIHADIQKLEGDVDVNGKNICILDDIIATGGTIMHASKHLKSLGAKRIIVGATHGVFSGEKIAEKILSSSCEELFATNAIQREDKSVKILKLPKN